MKSIKKWKWLENRFFLQKHIYKGSYYVLLYYYPGLYMVWKITCMGGLLICIFHINGVKQHFSALAFIRLSAPSMVRRICFFILMMYTWLNY